METNILIVDDEAAIADLVEVYLKNEGYTVHKFGRAGDALACVASTPLDLAILDVMLPDMDGFTLCQKIREAHLFPILMLTARVEDMDSSRARRGQSSRRSTAAESKPDGGFCGRRCRKAARQQM